MPYRINELGHIVHVKTGPTVSHDERCEIVGELTDRCLRDHVLIIDHMNSRIESELVETAAFGRLVAKLAERNPGIGIYIAASEDNRRHVDIPAEMVHRKGVPVRVFESMQELATKVAAGPMG